MKIKHTLLALVYGYSLSFNIFSETTDSTHSCSNEIWPEGIKCVVSLSYDDGLPVHYELVAPLLEAYDMRATFYLFIKDLEHYEKWKEVAAKGHELGNHSLFHPCRRYEGYESWLAEYYDLRHYSPGRFRDELMITNKFLSLLDGGKPRTYGNTCMNLTIGMGDEEIPMDPILDELFVAARGTITNKPIHPHNPTYTRLGHYGGDGKTFEQIRDEIEYARATGGWVVYMFHGIGEDTHSLFINEVEHEKLINWLNQERDSIWTAPVVDVASYLKTKNTTE